MFDDFNIRLQANLMSTVEEVKQAMPIEASAPASVDTRTSTDRLNIEEAYSTNKSLRAYLDQLTQETINRGTQKFSTFREDIQSIKNMTEDAREEEYNKTMENIGINYDAIGEKYQDSIREDLTSGVHPISAIKKMQSKLEVETDGKIGKKTIAASLAKETASSVYAGVLGTLEGMENHIDTQGITTNAYGVVNDSVNHPDATINNKAEASILGINLDTATPEQSKQVAISLVKKSEKKLKTAVPNWEKLDNTSKAFMIDFHFNGGVTAVDLPKALEKYQKDPSKANLKAIGKEARRSQKVRDKDGNYVKLPNGKYKRENIKGLDNRVARIMKHFKLIKNLDEAKQYGLPLASDK